MLNTASDFLDGGFSMAVMISKHIQALLTSIGLAACAVPVVAALAAQPQSEATRLTQIETWKVTHQDQDDDQSRQIEGIKARLEADDLRNESRLTHVETVQQGMVLELDGLSTKIWALLVAVFSQLVNAVWAIVKDRSKEGSRGRNN